MPVAAEDVASTVVVVTAMPLSGTARAELSALLGSGYTVVDIKVAPPTANIVLTPVVSGQLLGLLRGSFPRARILFTELEDDERGISFTGPLSRIVAQGPDGYFLAHTLDALGPVVQSEARMQLSGRTRRTPLTLSSAPVSAEATSPPPPPVPRELGVTSTVTVRWLDKASPAPPGRRLELDAVDALVARVADTDEPRRDALWPALVAECVVRLADGRDDVLVDVTGLDPAIRAELQIRVASERIDQDPLP